MNTKKLAYQVIDEAPATRFMRRLIELIECGYGLDTIQPKTAHDAEPVGMRLV